MERLDKLLAGTGRWSRREAAGLIKAGRVKVDDTVARSREDKVPAGAVVRVDGEEVDVEGLYYLMLNKPAGLVSATDDPRQPTVLSLLPDHLKRVGLFPAGRLDKDTVGFLLLTNDGPLAHALLSPRRHVDKTYYVEVEGTLTEEDTAAFRRGLVLPDGLECLPARLELLGPDRARVTLREGKYHQIKRMLAFRGKPVRFLERCAFGPLALDPALERGQWRPLSEGEKSALRKAGNPPSASSPEP